MSEIEVCDDVAEQEFERFLEAMDLVPPDHLDDEDRKGFESAKKTFVHAVKTGALRVNEKGEPEFTPRDDKGTIVFHEPTGASYMASDSKRKGHDVAKSFAAMADQTGQNMQRFAQMANRDLKVCQAIQVLFFA